MSWDAVFFWPIALLTIVPGIFMIVCRDIVHMAFWLLATLSGVACLYLFMGADFLGMTQIFVYVGGINVLLLFGIMLTNKEPVFVRKAVRRVPKAPALLLGFFFLVAILRGVGGTEWRSAPAELVPTAKNIGVFLLSEYVLPFEIVSILLLVVLIGAAFIARRGIAKGDA